MLMCLLMPGHTPTVVIYSYPGLATGILVIVKAVRTPHANKLFWASPTAS